MAKSAGKKVSNTLVWILMGLLVVGLMGFGATNFTGGVQKLASVGDREIEAGDYARNLNQALQNLSQQLGGAEMTLAQAQELNLSQQVLGQLLLFAALDNENDALGFSVGNERVKREITGLPAFRNFGGQFDATVYRSALERVGLTVPKFEEQVRDEAARVILQSAVAGGIQAPDALANAFLDFVASERSFAYVTLDAGSLAEPVGAPDEATLRGYFAEVGAEYVVPETRNITYAWLSPAMLADAIEIDEGRLRSAYDARSDEFNRPERRLVERLIFEDEAAALAALARMEAGEATFEALVEGRGLTLADVDLGDVAADELGDAAEAVFGLEESGAAVVAPTVLGPAIFRVNAILYAQVTPFEEVRDSLHREEALEAARDRIAELVSDADDLLADGTTLEELAEETALELGRIAFTVQSAEGIAAYSNFRTAAGRVSAEDFPEIAGLDDGGIFALRLDGIDAERPQTFEEARPALTQAWTDAQVLERLKAEAGELADRWRGGASAEELGRTPVEVTGASRQSAPQGVPAAVLGRVLEMAAGDIEVVGEGTTAFAVRLDAITPPDITDEEIAAGRRQLVMELSQSIARDVFSAYSTALQNSAGIRIDTNAVEAVHRQFP